MGFALAEMAQKMGANVSLITGPVSLATPAGVNRTDIKSAEQMFQVSKECLSNCDIFIGCAAVADYRPETIAQQKMKKQLGVDDFTIKLVKNPDIIAHIANVENPPFCVGFAAETNGLEAYALDKLKHKNLQLIAANDVAKAGQGFNSEKNALTVFSASQTFAITLADKKAVAFQLLEIISQQYSK